MAVYAALLYYPEDNDWSAPQHAHLMEQYATFGAEAGSAITGGAALMPASTATTVRVAGGAKGGDVLVADGPYAEAKEVLGGFYLLEAPDLDEALRLAALIPAAWHGQVEVRPVLPTEG